MTVKDEDTWSDKATQWNERIGTEGDLNRRFNSDPVLWRMIGDPAGLDVLDAGCGTGYLSVQLARRGARVRAVDYSQGMIEHAVRNIGEAKCNKEKIFSQISSAEAQLDVAEAKRDAARGDLAISVARDSCCTLGTIDDASCDLIVSNYVLMDLDDLDGAIASAARVLRPKGRMVAAFSHPCFEPDMYEDDAVDTPLTGPRSYFDSWFAYERWGEFKTPFPYYHRSLTTYWRAFAKYGFAVIDFEEPILQPPYPPEVDAETIARWRLRPFSIAMHLQKS